MDRDKKLIIVRGAGEYGTGVIQKLANSGFFVLALERACPLSICRHLSLANAVFDQYCQVEDVVCVHVSNFEEAQEVFAAGVLPLLVDEEARILERVRPWALVEAAGAQAKRPACREKADKIIALGAGFTAGKEVDLVVETVWGQGLGRLIGNGCASGGEGSVGFRAHSLYSEYRGIFLSGRLIGDRVKEGEMIGCIVTGIGEVEVKADRAGILRGLAREGCPVMEGMRIAEICAEDTDPEACFTVSPRARCIGGAVLEGVLYLEKKQGY